LGAKAFANLKGSLSRHVEIELDGKKLELPRSIRGVCVVNLPSYAGGTNPWGTKKSNSYHDPAIDDGVFEVFGIKGATHLAKLQVGLSSGIRLGQGRTIKFTSDRPLPAQVDGEPWLMIPAAVMITHNSRVRLYFNSNVKDAEEQERLLTHT